MRDPGGDGHARACGGVWGGGVVIRWVRSGVRSVGGYDASDPPARPDRGRPDRDHGGVRQHLGGELRVPRARSRIRHARRSGGRFGPRDDPRRRRAARGGVGGRIDPGTNDVVATIRVCHAPEGLAGTPGSVWVVCEDDDTVGRIDPAIERMTGTVDVGLSPRFALGAFGSLWVSNFVEGSVSRIDPVAGKVITTIDVESGPQLMLAASGGVWVSNTDAPAVQRIDPQTNTVGAPLEDAGTTPDGLVELDGAVWVASDSGPQLHRIDPTDSTVSGPWPVADQGTISANQLLVAVDGTFWVPLFNQNEVVQIVPPASTS